MNTPLMSPVADELSIAILRRLADSPDVNQRDLARDAGVSLGRMNYALRALVEKGWVKAGNFGRSRNKLRYAYLLTPRGFEAKARLTRNFLARKVREYDALRNEIERLRQELGEAGAQRDR